jgi:putative FmdB family regulatory protein
MPIFEYRCKHCSCHFETLIWAASDLETVRCPRCQAAEVERMLSCFSLAGSGGSAGSSPCPTKSTGFS